MHVLARWGFIPEEANRETGTLARMLSEYNAFHQMLRNHPKQHNSHVKLVQQGVKLPDYDNLEGQLIEACTACKDFASQFDKYSRGRRFASSSNGRKAWVLATPEPGDRIVALQPSRIPFVLRRAGSGYRILGDRFLQGQMTGKFFQRLAESP